MMSTTREPLAWLAVILMAVGLALITLGNSPGRGAMAAILATGTVLTGISAWTWWRTTLTFMQYLRDFRKWGLEQPA